jgi:hypothetical protein
MLQKRKTGGTSTYRFKQFSKQFDSTIWSFILSSGIAISLLLLLVINCDQRHTAGCKRKILLIIDRFLRLVMGIFGTLIDNNGGFKLPKTGRLRILLLTWALATIILGNGYKGTVTSKFIAPEAEERLKTFEDATSLQKNLSVYTSISQEMLQYTEAAKLKGLNINISNWRYFKFMERLVYDQRWYKEIPRIGNVSTFLQIFERLWKNLNPHVEISERNLFPKEFVLKCNSSIFVDTSELLPKMMNLHGDVYPPSEIYLGKDKFMNVAKYVYTYGIGQGIMSIRLRALSHSGMIQKIIADREYISQMKSNRTYRKEHKLLKNYTFISKENTSISAISLHSETMQIFVISAYLLSLSCFIFFLEIISSLLCSGKWVGTWNWLIYNKATRFLAKIIRNIRVEMNSIILSLNPCKSILFPIHK